jgi:hypothetical protein
VCDGPLSLHTVVAMESSSTFGARCQSSGGMDGWTTLFRVLSQDSVLYCEFLLRREFRNDRICLGPALGGALNGRPKSIDWRKCEVRSILTPPFP